MLCNINNKFSNSSDDNYQEQHSEGSPQKQNDNEYLINTTSNDSSSIGPVKVEDGSGVGRLYFCGLVRMSQHSYFNFMMIIEIINLLSTLLFFLIIVSDKNLSKHNKKTTMTFQFIYLLLGNFAPLIVLSVTLCVFKKIETFDNPQLYFEKTFDNYYYRKIYGL